MISMATRVRCDEEAIEAVRLRVTSLVHKTKIGQAAMARIATTHAMGDRRAEKRQARSFAAQENGQADHAQDHNGTGIQGARNLAAAETTRARPKAPTSVVSRYRRRRRPRRTGPW